MSSAKSLDDVVDESNRSVISLMNRLKDEEVPNPELGGEKEEKQEIGPVDSLGKKDEEEVETSSVKTPANGDGEGRTGGQFSDRSVDRSSDRSPGNKRVEQTKSTRSLVSRNDEETQEKTSRCKLVDFYRAIDRFGPVRGPVRDRSSDRSPFIPSYNEEEDRGNECSKNQKYDQLEEEIRRQVDSYRAIDRSGPVRGPVRGPFRDRSSHSSERSPLFPSHNEGESLENECGGNQKYHQLEDGEHIRSGSKVAIFGSVYSRQREHFGFRLPTRSNEWLSSSQERVEEGIWRSLCSISGVP